MWFKINNFEKTLLSYHFQWPSLSPVLEKKTPEKKRTKCNLPWQIEDELLSFLLPKTVYSSWGSFSFKCHQKRNSKNFQKKENYLWLEIHLKRAHFLRVFRTFQHFSVILWSRHSSFERPKWHSLPNPKLTKTASFRIYCMNFPKL